VWRGHTNCSAREAIFKYRVVYVKHMPSIPLVESALSCLEMPSMVRLGVESDDLMPFSRNAKAETN
jgi:hypothetical protein